MKYTIEDLKTALEFLDYFNPKIRELIGPHYYSCERLRARLSFAIKENRTNVRFQKWEKKHFRRYANNPYITENQRITMRKICDYNGKLVKIYDYLIIDDDFEGECDDDDW